jgi:hypothetical protein
MVGQSVKKLYEKTWKKVVIAKSHYNVPHLGRDTGLQTKTQTGTTCTSSSISAHQTTMFGVQLVSFQKGASSK